MKNQQILEAMIRKARLYNERFPDALIAGVVFVDTNSTTIIPTDNSEQGFDILKDHLSKIFKDGEMMSKTFTANEN